jgi:hypothetical protein
MIILDEIKQEENYSHNLFITYPKTVQISYGVYDNVVDMHNMCTMISQNIDKSEITNVYGGKTPWGFFNDKPEFKRFIDYLVQKHQTSNVFLNKKNWYSKNISFDSWGNEIKKGDSVVLHAHKDHHLILYLTEGAPLIIPELKMKIMPKRGAYYLFPPQILHGVEKVEVEDKTRYCLVSNIIDGTDWKKNKLILDAQKNLDEKNKKI